MYGWAGGVTLRHNQIFSVGWFTKFSYPWWSAARALCARDSSVITFSDVKSFKSVLMMFHIVDFSDLNKLQLITKGELFLCDSGDEIIWGEERCDLRNDCYDLSDEKNCSNRKLRL